MSINWTTITAGLETALKAAEEFAPLLGLAGAGGAAAAKTIGAAAAFADAALSAASAAKTANAPGASDLASLQAANQKLQLLNDAAAEQVAAT